MAELTFTILRLVAQDTRNEALTGTILGTVRPRREAALHSRTEPEDDRTLERVPTLCCQPVKNKSELLFEGYLRANGYPAPVFEKQFAGTLKRPDYALEINDREYLFEVKEFQSNGAGPSARFGYVDAYTPIREKIDAARDKFKDLKDYCCSLVLHNRSKPLVFLDWEHIYGAILGDLAWSVPIHVPGQPPPPTDAPITTVFTDGGKMLWYGKGGLPTKAVNTTISAILVVDRVMAGQRRFSEHLGALEKQLGRPLTDEERWAELEAAPGTERDYNLRPLRVVVHENPYAGIPLPGVLFRGPYDERYGGLDGRIQRLFEGTDLAKLPPK